METPQSLETLFRQTVRDIPDFPKPGIIFKDITPVLAQPTLCDRILDRLADYYHERNIEAVAGIEARGFIFGMALARQLHVPFIPVRKEGKLPHTTLQHAYELEYGNAIIEIHEDAVPDGARVLIHDDLLATGGTAEAAAKLIGHKGQVAGFNFLMNLTFLNGAERLKPYAPEIYTLVDY